MVLVQKILSNCIFRIKNDSTENVAPEKKTKLRFV